MEFSGTCAQGVLDPLIFHVPSAVLILWFFLEHPRGHGSEKCDPWWIVDAGRDFFLIALAPEKTTFGRVRTDQGPQLTHYIPQGLPWIFQDFRRSS